MITHVNTRIRAGQSLGGAARSRTPAPPQRFDEGLATLSSLLALEFAPGALRALHLHPWPGNVHELQNRVQRAIIMANGKRVTANDLELTEALSALPPQTLKEAREGIEREIVRDALRLWFAS